MSFLNWLENNYCEDLQTMSDQEKGEALHAFLTDPSLKKIIIQGVVDYMVEDHHIAKAMIVSDAQAGKDIKDCVYACYESEIVDAMEAYSRYVIGADWLSPVLEATL